MLRALRHRREALRPTPLPNMFIGRSLPAHRPSSASSSDNEGAAVFHAMPARPTFLKGWWTDERVRSSPSSGAGVRGDHVEPDELRVADTKRCEHRGTRERRDHVDDQITAPSIRRVGRTVQRPRAAACSGSRSSPRSDRPVAPQVRPFRMPPGPRRPHVNRGE